MMEWYQAALLLAGGLVLLMFIGVPVAMALFSVNLVGVIYFMGGIAGIEQLLSNAAVSVTNFSLAPIPLFLIMGELLFHSGLAIGVFSALDMCFGRIKGRLSYLTVFGGTLFATLSGSSIANTALLGTTLMPDMQRRGYKKKLIMGPIIGTGGLAMIIPPSALAVLLGSLARIDVGALLIAGLLPGLVLAGLYFVAIWIMIRLDPDAAPGYVPESHGMSEIVTRIMRDVLPMGLVVFCVVGLILLGWATPTESAACGVLAVLILSAIYGRLSFDMLRNSLMGTVKVSGMMLLVVMGSTTFSQVLAFSGASQGLISFATGFDVTAGVMLLIMLIVLIVMGMFMEQLSIMMLTLPIFLPLASLYGFDPVWFGIVMLLALELSLATPPFGLLLFVMLGVSPAGTTMKEVVYAAFPFVLCTLVLLLLLAIFPDIALWLPSMI